MKLDYKTIVNKEVDGVKYHSDIWEKYFTQTVFVTIQKAGDAVFINWEGATGLKIDYPIKFAYREVHNEKVVIEEPQDYPMTIDEEDGLPEPETKTGTRTIVENFNPTFTVQLKIDPTNWGKLKRILVRKSRTVEVPKFYLEENWQEILGNDGVWEKLTEIDKVFLTTNTDVELRKWFFETLGRADRTTWGNRIQALFSLPPTETKTEYYYEAREENTNTGTLKNVDIDVEVIGENYSKIIHIDKGSIMTCSSRSEMGAFSYYGFHIPILPFICDWFGVPIPKEEKSKPKRVSLMKNIIRGG